jgi:enoyl-CoA hydratase / 3-hydroxyacyl-CoA dehydrogenase
MKEIKNFVVLGAGAMGAQIGGLAAENGFNVKIRDVDDKYIQRGRGIIENVFNRLVSSGKMTEEKKKEVMGRITFLLDLKEAVKDADFIMEAVPEILELKQKVLKEVTSMCPPDAVIATNTSSLSISEVAKGAAHPEWVVGTHYFNPPRIMSLLEIIRGEKTSDEAVAIAIEVAKKMNRDIVTIKDVPGFLVNRIWIIMESEADWALSQGEARSMIQIDSAAKYKLGLPLGMFEISDTLEGGVVETIHHIMEYFQRTLGPSYNPAPGLDKAYKAGAYGKKTGKGYYDWSPGVANEIPMNAGADFDPIRILAPAVNEAAILMDQKATSRDEIDRGVLLGLNYPRGILRMADSYGLDKIVAEMNRLKAAYKVDRYNCAKTLTDLVVAGKFGRSTGEGFYSYAPGQYEFLKLNIDVKTKIAKLTLNRTYRANALNTDFIAEINAALDICEKSDDIKAVILTGAGANFCGGADVSAFASGKADSVMGFSLAGQNLFMRIETFPKVIIGAINGPAMGGGFELALATDIRVMSKKAILRLPELGLGLIPGFGGTQRLIRLIGAARAKEAILLGDQITSDKALSWGIVNFVAEPEKFNDTVNEIAAKIAAGAPLAQKMAKAAIYNGGQADQRTGLYLESSIVGDLALSKDLSEGLTAMNYRRNPKFKGE